ncbi:hypothetical protein DE146DRAFT_781722 [Phaeosphaeria sp. MPI-PUGE-AT-0046c]|nr:hypothetical protein DE146DRAFT_781722 [Phaeosphaeria sp. MPI-PUGE-AT-0046c]
MKSFQAWRPYGGKFDNNFVLLELSNTQEAGTKGTILATLESREPGTLALRTTSQSQLISASTGRDMSTGGVLGDLHRALSVSPTKIPPASKPKSQEDSGLGAGNHNRQRTNPMRGTTTLFVGVQIDAPADTSGVHQDVAILLEPSVQEPGLGSRLTGSPTEPPLENLVKEAVQHLNMSTTAPDHNMTPFVDSSINILVAASYCDSSRSILTDEQAQSM